MADRSETVHQRFTAVARRYPDRKAIVGRLSLTYRQLDALSDRFAARLAAAGVSLHAPVVLCLHRSPETFVAILAILKLGGIFVPMDPAYPPAVKRTYIDRLGARHAVVRAGEGADLDVPGLAVIGIDVAALDAAAPSHPLAAGLDEDHPAYVMFTSGSTGSPKGVVVPHRGILRLVIDTNYVTLGSDDRVLQLSPLTFDASTFEIWGALLNGGCLVLYENPVFDLNAVNALVKRERVTVMWLTAALFHLAVRRYLQVFEGLRVLLAGGDVLQPAAVRAVLARYPDLTLINGYGPTENTTFTCCHVMTAASVVGETVPIGTPITGTTAHVLDENRQPVPAGGIGELYAGGRGVALGYLDAPEQTAAVFIPNPFGSGCLYKTGDRVRQTAGNVFEFLGRVDNQVKIRGHRVSIEEVQRVLREVGGVDDGVICVQNDASGEKRLVAFIQSNQNPEEFKNRVRDELARNLPHYMMPDVIHVKAELPVNVNGKLDRRKLSHL